MLSGNPARPLTAASPPNPPPTIMTRCRLSAAVEQWRSAELKVGLGLAAARPVLATCIVVITCGKSLLPPTHQAGVPASSVPKLITILLSSPAGPVTPPIGTAVVSFKLAAQD